MAVTSRMLSSPLTVGERSARVSAPGEGAHEIERIVRPPLTPSLPPLGGGSTAP